ncbi:hypothetical protein PAAG_12114 [Paracoccidioides lutzii Pb01]|uniref:Uncharacterized protein n=1 Tax=Paracoccidioides lutzii (strain ATCC MYA-826 / Pb01) TaxID=502779 RepID=A0A0A2V4Z6_PARBA|nr:hypothetical protein PAAG_12114 [Paracoccidioides lutzii Pb01]KGQ01170.1 hypothetical protein PAAG_12114 [Paracoccidioides lutzii Pb01]
MSKNSKVAKGKAGLAHLTNTGGLADINRQILLRSADDESACHSHCICSEGGHKLGWDYYLLMSIFLEVPDEYPRDIFPEWLKARRIEMQNELASTRVTRGAKQRFSKHQFGCYHKRTMKKNRQTPRKGSSECHALYGDSSSSHSAASQSRAESAIPGLGGVAALLQTLLISPMPGYPTHVRK